MKLSKTMVNALGYMFEREGWCGKRTLTGLVTVLGVKAALKNSLIEEADYDPPATQGPVSALAFMLRQEAIGELGYKLTEKGRDIGQLGCAMRMMPDKIWVTQAQAVLDAAS